MEFLLMADDMIDPSSFLEEETAGTENDLNWCQWSSSPNGGGENAGRKRKYWEGRQCVTSSDLPPEKQGLPTKLPRCDSSVSGRLNAWHQVEDIADNLAADLDGTCSLSGIGVDLNNSAYNISEALLALPSLTVFKQELPSPTTNNENSGSTLSPVTVNTTSNKEDPCSDSSNPTGSPPSIHKLLSPYNSGSKQIESSHNERTDNFQQIHSTNNNGLVVTSVAARSTGSPSVESTEDCRFQYVLAAATSIATKINEETLTYLNQGQSYEIKLKKLGDLTEYRGKILKSIIRLCFHERRLQFMEREQIAAWEASRPGDRIMEVDLPLSYGMFDLLQDPALLNTVEFLWDPTKEVGVYIKVNCISTEFTPKKHGGEKGVPFRIQVDTYLHGDKLQRKLHSASCQIKVFKLKGADRKHKQDREKILKRPSSEQDKYQPSYECTVFSDIPPTADCIFGTPVKINSTSTSATITPDSCKGGRTTGSANPTVSSTKDEPLQELPASAVSTQLLISERANKHDNVINGMQALDTPLTCNATAQQTTTWLQLHRFSAYIRTLSSFSGADLLRMSRDDLIQICGLADGIRMFNALHAKAKTVYLCVQTSPIVYHAVYLATLSSQEMKTKLASLVGVSVTQIHDVYMQGPGGIHVIISDELMNNIKDEATFTVEVLQDHSSDHCCLLLKPPVSAK